MRPSERSSSADRLVVLLGDDPQSVRPDDAAHDGGVAEQLLLRGRKQVDPRRHDPEDAVGQSLDVPARGICMRTNSSA